MGVGNVEVKVLVGSFIMEIRKSVFGGAESGGFYWCVIVWNLGSNDN